MVAVLYFILYFLKNGSILIICNLKCTRLFKKARAAFDQGRGFERVRGRGGGW